MTNSPGYVKISNIDRSTYRGGCFPCQAFPGKCVTLQDVARATGYTANTVSRALKNKPDISAETSKKIQDAARRMGYVRNAIAGSLRSGHTRTLGVIVGGMSNPYYGRMTDSIQDAAAEEGYSLLGAAVVLAR